MRRTITGIFHRDRQRKPRKNFGADFAALILEDSGVIEPQYYPDTIWITENADSKRGYGKQVWKVSNRCAGPLKNVEDLDHVTVEARVKPWDNRHGGDLTHIRLICSGSSQNS